MNARLIWLVRKVIHIRLSLFAVGLEDREVKSDRARAGVPTARASAREYMSGGVRGGGGLTIAGRARTRPVTTKVKLGYMSSVHSHTAASVSI